MCTSEDHLLSTVDGPNGTAPPLRTVPSLTGETGGSTGAHRGHLHRSIRPTPPAMKSPYAFERDDLMDLLDLDLTEPADQDDIESIRDILARRWAAHADRPDVSRQLQARTGLHLVPDPTP
jgi:hypothetical protein